MENKTDEIKLFETNNLTKALDDLCGKYPPEIIPRIWNYENKHRYLMTNGPVTYGRFNAQFNVFFNLVNRLLIDINFIKKDSWPPYRGLQWLLATNNIRCLYNAQDNLLKGHWEDMMVLGRVNLEAMIRIIWMSLYSDNYEAGIIKQRKTKQFNFTSFIKDELGLKWLDYQMMSMVIHANQPAVLKDWLAVSKKEKKYPICFEMKYDKLMFEMCVNYILFLSNFYLKIVLEILYRPAAGNLNKEIITDAKNLSMNWSKTMSLHIKDYWPQVAKDMDDLIKLVLRYEGDKDWKKGWFLIRPN